MDKTKLVKLQKTKTEYTHEIRLKKIKEICELYSQNKYTIESCCDTIGLGYNTFHDYTINEKSKYYRVDFGEIYKNAKENRLKLFKNNLKRLAETALEKKLKGYETTETTINGEHEGKAVQTKKKIIAPDTTAIIFTLKNIDPDNWREKQDIEHTGQIDTKLNISVSANNVKNKIKGVIDGIEDD